MQTTKSDLHDDTMTLAANRQTDAKGGMLPSERRAVEQNLLILDGKPGKIEQQALQLAQTKECILIQSEPGGGKHYYAGLIHSKSARGRLGDFVELTARASDEELKAVLFNEDRKRCEGMLGRTLPYLDARSTLFVNHIHEFSLINQTRISRFLIQNNPGSAVRGPKVRVILSTCIPWQELLRKRLVVESLDEQVRQFQVLVILPLRDRREDIPAIVASLLRRIASERGGKRIMLKPDTLNQLIRHQWWDNVRELKMVLEDAARSSRNGSLILPARFFDEVERIKESIGTLQMGKTVRLEDVLGIVERTLIQRALMRSESNLARSARLLGLTEQNLRYRIRKFNLHVPSLRKRK
jgi:Nif-specific regulatory protein